MHIYTWIALLVAIASVVECSSVLDETHREGKGISHDQEAHIEGEEISQEYETDREGRRIKKNRGARLNFGILDSFLDIIDFGSGNCTTGTCMSQKDCTNMNGTDTGDRCVQGFGVCCVMDDPDVKPPQVVYAGGNITITGEGGDFFNPAYTDNLKRQPPPGCYLFWTATLEPANDIVQMKIDIRSLEMMGPIEGDCGNDLLVITGANPGLEIPILCGSISDQQLYIDIDNSDGPYKIVIYKNCYYPEIPRSWDIGIRFLKEADAVPRRCLQYHTAKEGTIKTFNFDGDTPMMINDQRYTICFGYVVGYCDVAITFTRMQLGQCPHPDHGTITCENCGDNYFLLSGFGPLCGGINGGTYTANATGPISVGVRSGAVNEVEEEGFSATYMMIPC